MFHRADRIVEALLNLDLAQNAIVGGGDGESDATHSADERIPTIQSTAEALNWEDWNSNRRFANVGVPICLLPDELFAQCFRYHSSDPRHMTVISQVCRRFRSASLQTPSLWRYVYIRQSAEKGPSMEAIRTRLERSAIAPLVVTIHFVETSTIANRNEIVTLAHEQLSRTSELHLSADRLKTILPFLPIPRPHPLLRNVSFSIDEQTWDRLDFITIFDSPEASTDLYSLKIRADVALPAFRLLAGTFTSLRHLELFGYISVDDIYRAIESSSQTLESLSLQSLSNRGRYDRPTKATSITLPNLRTLHLGTVPTSAHKWLMPALTSLTIDGDSVHATYLEAAYFPSLKEAVINQFSYGPSTMTDLFRRHPFIEVLALRARNGVPSILHAIASSTTTADVMLPYLHTFRLQFRPMTSVPKDSYLIESLRALVTARQNVVNDRGQFQVVLGDALDLPLEYTILAAGYPRSIRFER